MGGSDFRRAHGTDHEASAEARPSGPPGVSAELSFDVEQVIGGLTLRSSLGAPRLQRPRSVRGNGSRRKT